MKRDKAYKGKSWDVKNQLVKLIDQVIFPPPPNHLTPTAIQAGALWSV